MLNNRQPGRRRGRNNQRPQGNAGRNQDNGNRIDNRARGNAPQLLEKYKALARDAQMQGDRVLTEYYHQFADHYFRVTAEMRARFEENRKQRDDWQGDEGDEQGFDDRAAIDNEDGGEDDNSERAYEAQRRQQQQYGNRDRQPERGEPRQDRGDRQARPERDDRPERAERNDNDRAPRRNARETGNRDNVSRDNANRDTPNRENVSRDYAPRESTNRNGGWRNDRDDRAERTERDDAIDVNVLPPAFGSDGPVSQMLDLDDAPMAADVSEAPAPKRRGRPRKVVAEAEAAE